MAKNLTRNDPPADFESREAEAAFLIKAFKTNNAASIAHALGRIARAKGVAEIAAKTGLSREQLYKSLSRRGNPTLKTTLAVMNALGFRLRAKIKREA